MEKVKGWLNPDHTGDERRPLLETGNGQTNGGYFAEQTETDAEDDAYESSNDLPTSGYETYYSTFPSVRDQSNIRHREKLLFRGMVAFFMASFILLLIASTLVATGKHKLLVEVDAGAIVGILSSLFFGAAGLGMSIYTTERLTWLYRTCVGVTFAAVCLFNGMLLLLVVGNGGL